MKLLHAFNQLLAFSLEMAMLAALVYWGIHASDSILAKCMLAIGVPLAVIGVWGMWLAPNAGARLHMPWLLLVKAIIFGGSVVALYFAGQKNMAVVFAGATALSFVLSAITKDF